MKLHKNQTTIDYFYNIIFGVIFNFDVVDITTLTTWKITNVAKHNSEMSQHVGACVKVVKFWDVVTFEIQN